MTRYLYQIEVDRVVVTGAGSVAASELQALLGDAVARELTHARLPTGRTMRSSVQVEAPRLTGSPAAARAIARGVAAALTGGSTRG